MEDVIRWSIRSREAPLECLRPLWVVSPERAFRQGVNDFLIGLKLGAGQHVHIVDQDGEWCLDDRHECELWPIFRGPSPAFCLFDEVSRGPDES